MADEEEEEEEEEGLVGSAVEDAAELVEAEVLAFIKPTSSTLLMMEMEMVLEWFSLLVFWRLNDDDVELCVCCVCIALCSARH